MTKIGEISQQSALGNVRGNDDVRGLPTFAVVAGFENSPPGTLSLDNDVAAEDVEFHGVVGLPAA